MKHEGKTLAKSFRISEKALDALREEAESQELGLNTLVNQLLVNYAAFGRYLKRMNVMIMSQQTVGGLLEMAPEEGVIKVAQNTGKAVPEAVISAIDGKLTVQNVMEYIHNLSSYANFFEYTEKKEAGHSTITLMHEMGRKWSLFIANYISQAFAAAGFQAKYSIADRYVTFTV